MSNRVTKAELDGAFERYTRAASRLEWTDAPGRYELRVGSKVYGVAYRVWWVLDGTRQLVNPPGAVDGYLGTTKREAMDALHTMARCFEDAAGFMYSRSEVRDSM